MKRKKNKEPIIKKDFSEVDMPHNRFQAFWDIVKIRYDVLLKFALIFFIFLLPLIIALFTKNVMIGKLDDAYRNAEIAEESYRSSLLQLNFIFVFIEAFCLILISIPISGIIRIYRLLTFYEGIVFKTDFFQGIKDNIKQVLLVFFFSSIFYIISKMSIHYLMFTNQNDVLSTIIFFLPAVLSILIILPISIMHINQISIYNNKYTQNIKNSFFLYLKSGFIILPISILLIAPLFLMIIKILYMPIIVLMIYGIVWLPFMMLIIYLICNSVFDKYINKEQYPSIFDKGVYRIKDK